MKLNVIFIKIKSLIFVFCFSITILFGFLLINKLYKNLHNSVPTMAKPQLEEYLKDDLNGDSKDDLLYISCKNNLYYMEAHINDKTYFFNVKDLNTLGEYNESWPLSVKLIDLNNDNIPEIITEASLGDTSTTHVFMLYNNEFKDVFCSTDNFLGVLNLSDLSSPVLISSSTDTSFQDLNTYVLDNNVLKKTPINNLSLQGANIINDIIYFMESKETKYDIIQKLLSDNISDLELSTLQNLKTDNYTYIFESCFLESRDLPLSSNMYTLTFKKYNEYENNKVTLNICIDKINDAFLVTSIK